MPPEPIPQLFLHGWSGQPRQLSEWALRIAARRGKRIAAVALARKLAGILFAMTQHGRDYEPERLRRAVAEPPAVAA